VSGKGLELEGEGMEISIRDEKIRFFNKVKTRIQPDQFEKKRLASES